MKTVLKNRTCIALASIGLSYIHAQLYSTESGAPQLLLPSLQGYAINASPNFTHHIYHQHDDLHDTVKVKYEKNRAPTYYRVNREICTVRDHLNTITLQKGSDSLNGYVSWSSKEASGEIGEIISFYTWENYDPHKKRPNVLASQSSYRVVSPYAIGELRKEFSFFNQCNIEMQNGMRDAAHSVKKYSLKCIPRFGQIWVVPLPIILSYKLWKKLPALRMVKWSAATIGIIFTVRALYTCYLLHKKCCLLRNKHNDRYYSLSNTEPPTSFLLDQAQTRQDQWYSLQYLYDSDANNKWYVDKSGAERSFAHTFLTAYCKAAPQGEKYNPQMLATALKILEGNGGPNDYSGLICLVREKMRKGD